MRIGSREFDTDRASLFALGTSCVCQDALNVRRYLFFLTLDSFVVRTLVCSHHLL